MKVATNGTTVKASLDLVEDTHTFKSGNVGAWNKAEIELNGTPYHLTMQLVPAKTQAGKVEVVDEI